MHTERIGGCELIAKHLDITLIDIPIVDTPEATVCAFLGKPISQGCKVKDCLSSNFTDQSYLRHSSKYVCAEVAACLKQTIKTEKGANCIRNYSFYADEHELRLLKRDDILSIMLDIPRIPFVLGVSSGFKKHISFKCRLNFSKENYILSTDTVPVIQVNLDEVNKFYPIIQSWYTVVAGKESTTLLPTYFNKNEIMGDGEVYYDKIFQYGEERYFAESAILDSYRDTQVFNFFVDYLRKGLH